MPKNRLITPCGHPSARPLPISHTQAPQNIMPDLCVKFGAVSVTPKDTFCLEPIFLCSTCAKLAHKKWAQKLAILAIQHTIGKLVMRLEGLQQNDAGRSSSARKGWAQTHMFSLFSHARSGHWAWGLCFPFLFL